jgi:hypothetical protein
MAKKTKAKKKKPAPPRTVPRRKKGEALTAYHDRLSALAREAHVAGDQELSDRLQRKAGKIAHEHEQVARRPRKGKGGGPGTYPWYQCVEDQTRRARAAGAAPDEARDRANRICGRIRANSRAMYPDYWAAREGKAVNPAEVGVPYAAIVLDGGPRAEPHRDIAVVVDRGGTILDLHPILSDHSMRELDSKYPGLPLFGPLQVLASNLREIYRAAETPHVQVR